MTLTAHDIRQALHKRWPPDSYVVIEEAPDDASRQGSKIDMLAIACWRSRGFQTDAVEIKVSAADWKKELDNPRKADWWWEHCNRFWLAAPSNLATKIKEQVPDTWGLLSVSDEGRVTVLREAPRHNPTPFTWGQIVGLLRACRGIGWNQVTQAKEEGRREGIELGRKQAVQQTGNAILQADVERLRGRMEAFKEATGIDLAHTLDAEGARRIGEVYAAIGQLLQHPEWSADAIRRHAQRQRKDAEALDSLADELMATLRPKTEAAV